jgi:methyl-accepting chemotaxis protein
VRQAGEALTRIVDAARKVQETVAEVAAASAEQANGIDEMSQTVAHMDEMTQQNAALSEESAASANALSDRIGQLNDLVAQFRTSREGRAMQAQAYPAPAYATGGGSGRSAARRAPISAAIPATAANDPAGDSEPERLRQLAKAAFAQTRAAPLRVANARAHNDGWEEF